MQEWTVGELHEAYRSGRTDPLRVCREYLERIEAIDRSGPNLNSIIETNPEALRVAEEQSARLRDAPESFSEHGLLAGVPVLLKDNIDTSDAMHTTAGSLALVDAPTPEDAFLVARLREHGAIILGKTNLSEWANFRSTHSNSGWSSRGGQTRNPYVLDRSPCGSSSGSAAAIAANLAVIAVGTETDGSITCPAAQNSLVGIKPTVGSVSRRGVIPISFSQDTAGPIARTVADAAVLLAAMAGPDADDPASTNEAVRGGEDCTVHLDAGFIRGRRIGVPRASDAWRKPVAAAFAEACASLEAAGAVLVRVDLPDFGEAGGHEYTVLLYEIRHSLDAYLRGRGGAITSFDELIAYNEKHADAVMPFFGQEHLLKAATCDSLDAEEYREALREAKRIAGADGIFSLLESHELDAIAAPSNGLAWLIDPVNGDYPTGGGFSRGPAISGAPHITVPMGYHRELPLGLSFAGAFGDDARLIGIAYGFERAHPVRRPPRFVPTLGTDD
jgi:amidase